MMWWWSVQNVMWVVECTECDVMWSVQNVMWVVECTECDVVVECAECDVGGGVYRM